MSICKSCGAEIKWIKMTSGKMMPVDITPVRYLRAPLLGNLTFITEDGYIDRGFTSYKPDSEGYISHFATCPNASKHRKR